MEFRTISTRMESRERAVVADFHRKSPIPIDEETEKKLSSQKMQRQNISINIIIRLA